MIFYGASAVHTRIVFVKAALKRFDVFFAYSWSKMYISKLISTDWITCHCGKLWEKPNYQWKSICLKVPKHEIFVTELFTSDPIWVGDLRYEPKNHLWKVLGRYSPFCFFTGDWEIVCGKNYSPPTEYVVKLFLTYCHNCSQCFNWTFWEHRRRCVGVPTL